MKQHRRMSGLKTVGSPMDAGFALQKEKSIVKHAKFPYNI